ncbi:MAG: hypothetical protein WA130_01370 [Candidatus Methanoperedens sp.]
MISLEQLIQNNQTVPNALTFFQTIQPVATSIAAILTISAIIIAYYKKSALMNKIKKIYSNIKQFMAFLRLFPRLREVSHRNLNDLHSLIDFKIYRASINKAGASHYLELYFYIINCSIFNYETIEFSIVINDEYGSYLTTINKSKQMNLPFQALFSDRLKQELPLNSEILKNVKDECKSLQIQFSEVKIHLTGDKKISIPFGTYPLVISPNNIEA